MNQVVVDVVVKPIIATLVTLATMSVVGVGAEMVERERYRQCHKHHEGHHEDKATA